MTTPTDFEPARAISLDKPDSRPPDADRYVLALRVGGIMLVAMGWAISSLHELSATHMLLNAVAFGCLAVYAYTAATASRRLSVNTEKKLRLDLLVHNMELENMAMRDDLTQLFNRRYFFDRLERELEAARGFQRPLSVLLVDLDQLKAVNDTYGHRVGDQVLANFGQFLLSQTRASDVPARIGGDEFAIILPDTSETAAEVMITRFRQALEKTDLVEERDLSLVLTASMGVSGYPWGGDSVDAIMQKADAAMYADKNSRRQTLPPLNKDAAKRAEIPAMFRAGGPPGDDLA